MQVKLNFGVPASVIQINRPIVSIGFSEIECAIAIAFGPIAARGLYETAAAIENFLHAVAIYNGSSDDAFGNLDATIIGLLLLVG